ncbi:MAG: hypothetical protein L0J17_01315 [Brevibacterium sp.]|nr:hypothetical protein [Brevibacterium sp.]MDN5833202.1 hypothetical protein [Brevibacterium sp.]MDN5877298.1 hypothetical protein [Brevibacterium sp.]MDN5908695.1 hypothetical protein [Brevibacterium sp.]MDN6134832.1 hypothetical protein [Brevibacterium sp.]
MSESTVLAGGEVDDMLRLRGGHRDDPRLLPVAGMDDRLAGLAEAVSRFVEAVARFVEAVARAGGRGDRHSSRGVGLVRARGTGHSASS